MSYTIPQLLDAFETAVQNGNYRDARTTLDSIRQRYEQTRGDEQVRKARALAAREDSDRSADDVAATLVAKHARVNMVRGGFLTTASGYVASPEAVAAAAVSDAVSKLRTSEKQYAEASETAASVIDAVRVDPSVAVASISTEDTFHAKGVPFSMDAQITNAGDAAATGVSVSASSEADFAFAPSSPAVDLVPARSAATQGFEVTADETGEYLVTVKVTSENAGTASKQETVRVRGKVGLAKSAAESLGELLDVLQAERPLRKGQNDALVSKLENAVAKVDDAVAFADRGKRKQADNALNAATKMLGAALNQLDGLQNGGSGNGNGGNGKGNGQSGSGTSPDVVRSIERQIEGVLEQLRLSKRADI